MIVAGRYRRERLLGRGGMGEVHAAIDLRTDRRVAVKLMHGHRLDSADARARFEREARVGARIDSPYLVEVHDAGVDPDSGAPFLVMELLDGEDLEQRLARLGPRPAAEVVDHLGQVALALTRMHAERVVHRDLKPSNLFLQERRGDLPRIKVLDLGIAKELTDTGGRSTGIAGTPVYMAPEQISGGAIAPATDRYALGLIAFTLLVGAPYWEKGDGEEPIALAVKMKDGPRVAASTRARDCGATLTPAFDAWFERATARRPDRRFGSAIAAVRALAAALAVEIPAWLPDEPAPSAALDAAATLDDLSDAVAPTSPTVTAPPAAADLESTVLARPAAAAAISSDAPAVAIASSPAVVRRRRWLAPTASLLALGGAAIATFLAWPRAAAAPSPLARPGAILACPILAVDDVAESGWLGAAAASLACERARVLLGGLPSRTLLPAELLDLPAQITDDFPIDPYGAPAARATTEAAARDRGDAYLDGKVTRLGARFRVELVLRRTDRSELARGTGDADALEHAVRIAMQPLRDSDAIPTALIVDPFVADYSQAWRVATMLDYLDLNFALKNNAGQVRAECDRVSRAHPGREDRAQFARHECAYTLGLADVEVALEGTPATPGAEVTRARIEHMALRIDDPVAIARLEDLGQFEPSRWGRSSIAATLSCLLQKTGDDRAAHLAQRAIQHELKNPTGEWCAPWDQFVAIAPSGAMTRALQAWEPWHAYGWAQGAYDLDGDRALTYARRAYELSPLNTTMADAYIDHLIGNNQREAARTIALRLANSPLPTHALASQSALARIAASTASFDKALTIARAAMRIQPDDAGWMRTQRLDLALRALSISIILGREREIADAAVTELVLPDPAPIDAVYDGTPQALPTLCVYASPELAPRCFDRSAALLPHLAGAVLDSTTAYTEGARRYAAGDLPGAAEAWRPLIKDGGYGALAEAMVRAFAAIGEHDIVADIVAKGGTAYNGASMVTVRAAQAARDRGAHAEAAELASQVIKAWSAADVKPPVLAELKKMVR